VSARAAAKWIPGVALLGLFVAIPYLSVGTGGTFSGPLDSPGTLQLLALMLVFGGVAMSYDLLFGYTGLLSFGHALYFAVGVYLVAIATTRWGWEFSQAVLLAAAVGLVLPIVLGTICLRVGGIAFAMVTLAFAEAGAILVRGNPHSWTGADEGTSVAYEKLPASFVGVFNTVNLYWVALGFAVAVILICTWAVDSSPGRVWQAIRENELRVEVLGLRPVTFKLMVFTLGSFLATLGGVVYVLLIGTASPDTASPNLTLTLLIMVVLGGAGTRWGAFLGGMLYTFADKRLPTLAGSDFVQSLPSFLSTPLSEPLFVLGVLFILIVYFVPGGIAGLITRSPRVGLAALEGVVSREKPAEPMAEPAAEQTEVEA
jgi:branched-chain amino acid transport system permease protein